MLTPVDRDKLAHAKSLVDHFTTAELMGITRGEYPRQLRGYGARRIDVCKRAALIVLDAHAEAYPEANEWNRDVLKKRLSIMEYRRHQAANTTTAFDREREVNRRRALAQGRPIDGDKLDDRWS